MDYPATPAVTRAALSTARWLIPDRVDREEWLDRGDGDLNDARESLDDMWRINRWCGGVRAITQHLYPRLATVDGMATLLDLGTGSAHLPIWIARWARRTGTSVRILAADLNVRHLELARQQISTHDNIRLLQLDAAQLPLAANSVDYLISSLFLHHLSPEAVAALLREAFACVRRGMIFTDVTRGWLPYVGFKLTQPVFARSYLTRYDGAASIRRAYTPGELRALAASAGLAGARVTTHPLWRMTLVADKP